MEDVIEGIAIGVALLAIGGVGSSAFLRPKLFMDAYPHAAGFCIALMIFGAGAVYGGKASNGFLIGATGMLGALVLMLILKPVAMHYAKSKGDAG